MRNRGERPAQDFLFAPAEHFFRGGIPHTDDTLGVKCEDRRGGSLYYRLDQLVGLAQGLVRLLAPQGGAEGLRRRAQSLRFRIGPLPRILAVVEADETPPRLINKNRYTNNGLNTLPLHVPPGHFRQVSNHSLDDLPLSQFLPPSLKLVHVPGETLQFRIVNLRRDVRPRPLVALATQQFSFPPKVVLKNVNPAHTHGLSQAFQDGLDTHLPVTPREEFLGCKTDSFQNGVTAEGFSRLDRRRNIALDAAEGGGLPSCSPPLPDHPGEEGEHT